MSAAPHIIRPVWAAPEGVGALMSTRAGGVSVAPHDTLNVGVAVHDDPLAVRENRRRVAEAAGVPLRYLRQVHGAHVVALSAVAQDDVVEADGAWTDRPGLACAIQVADCMPVLFAAANGRAVGAAHAGWRGLAAGVLERTAQAVATAAGCGADAVCAWLGPGIGPAEFEVGRDVLDAFSPAGADPARFRPRPRRDGSPAWLANLPLLARDRLAQAGLQHVAGGEWCTVSEPSRFFSFRRDRVTGRMVAAVWLRG